MCGRYVLYGPAGRLVEAFDLRETPSFAPRYNIAPSAEVVVVLAGASGQRIARAMRWGLVPSWAKDPAIGARLANARAESVADKPAFRAAFGSRRCLIPANGFYEWQAAAPGARKQPWYIAPADGGFFAFAGLMERWGPREAPLYTTCIVTTAANALMAPIHDRMPALVAPADRARWLDPQSPLPELAALLEPAPDEAMRAWPVSRAVSSARNEGPALIEPVQVLPPRRD